MSTFLFSSSKPLHTQFRSCLHVYPVSLQVHANAHLICSGNILRPTWFHWGAGHGEVLPNQRVGLPNDRSCTDNFRPMAPDLKNLKHQTQTSQYLDEFTNKAGTQG
jgi:hypothetical protein